jgi:1-acyl-sn-glycerol-3-phosphate acyltransferase
MNLPAPRSLTIHELARYAVPGLMQARVEGLAPPPREGPLLVLINPCSMLDPWLLTLATGRPVRMGVETPLFWLPGLGSLAGRLNAVALPPQRPVDVETMSAEAAAVTRAYAEALDRGQAVAFFVSPEVEQRPEGPRYGLPPAFLDVLLATKGERIPVLPALAAGRGRRLRLLDNPLLARLLRAGASVAEYAWPPVLYSDNVLRLGRPVYWRDGGGSTLQEFRTQVEDSLGALY